MNEQQQQQEISAEEIDARIMVLISQRNKAMDDAVILGSKVVVLEKQVQIMQKQLAVYNTAKAAEVPRDKELITH